MSAESKGDHLKRVQAKLAHNGAFVRMMHWTIGIIGLYSMATLLYSFWGNPLINTVGSLIVGSSTRSGIPVSIAKALLPTFMAPVAVYVAIGVPLLLLAYQFGYQYLNEARFAPKPSAAALARDKTKERPEAEKAPDDTHKPDNGQQPPIPVAVAATKAQPGSANPIVSAFANQRQTRSQPKKAQQANEVEAPRATASKRRVAMK